MPEITVTIKSSTAYDAAWVVVKAETPAEAKAAVAQSVGLPDNYDTLWETVYEADQLAKAVYNTRNLGARVVPSKPSNAPEKPRTNAGGSFGTSASEGSQENSEASGDPVEALLKRVQSTTSIQGIKDLLQEIGGAWPNETVKKAVKNQVASF